MALPMPDWLNRVPRNRRLRARVRFLLRLAALYASERGTLTDLSQKCGFHPHSLSCTASARDRISPEAARLIESEVGRQFVTREMLAPEVYGDGPPR
jgi:hypothetical protein